MSVIQRGRGRGRGHGRGRGIQYIGRNYHGTTGKRKGLCAYLGEILFDYNEKVATEKM